MQSESLRERLSMHSSSNDDLFSFNNMSPSHSPFAGPNRRRSSVSPSSPKQAYSFPTMQVWPKPQAVPHTWKTSESEQVDEAYLFEINHQIKCLLTDLLNCESVKSDKLYRAWVQARLMDAEHELKRQRRRRSSAAQETLRAINVSNGLGADIACRASY